MNLLLILSLFGPPGQDGPPPISGAPLPPPSAPVEPERVATTAWRGGGWFALRATLGGPLDKGREAPASSRVVGLGWGFEFGYRARPWLGVGMGYHRGPHDLVQSTVDVAGTLSVVEQTGFLNSYELLVIRAFVPMLGRVEPWVDLAGGISTLDSVRAVSDGVGGQLRIGGGADFWIRPKVAIDLGLHYRINSVGASTGKLLRGAIGLKFHW